MSPRVSFPLVVDVRSRTGAVAGGATGLAFPHSVELHGDSDLVIADHAGNRVQVCPLFSPGADCTTVGGLDGQGAGPGQLTYPTGATVDGDGHYVITDRSNHRVQLCSSVVLGSCTTVAGTGTSGSGLQELNTPHTVALNALGDYIVADTYNHRVLKC